MRSMANHSRLPTNMKLILGSGVLLISIACTWSVPLPQRAVSLGPADGNLNIYALPVGQGDAQVVQCPSGRISLVDFGSNQWGRDDPPTRFWGPQEIQDFMGSENIDLIHNIIVTHNHWDHYSLLIDTFPSVGDLPGLQNLYISCTANDMASALGTWVRDAQLENTVRTWNGGARCGPRGGECDPIDLCPSEDNVQTHVLSVNLGQHCTDGGNKNIDSIVFKVIHGDVSLQFNGDFEDETSDWYENGPQKELVDYYGTDMQVTVYKLAHHGASFLANKPVFRDAVAPKALFVSANTDYSYRHPRCTIFDGFINFVGTLCKPQVTDPNDSFYCGESIFGGDLTPEETVQADYMCGTSSSNPPVYRTDNDYALYCTTPTPTTMSLLQFSSDGQRWGFKNNDISTY